MARKTRAKRALPASFKDRSTPSGGGKTVKKSGGGGKTKHTIIWKPSTVLRQKKK